jgi:hypothetical protein
MRSIKINCNEAANNFLNYYYINWVNNNNINEVLENYSKLIYNKTVYVGNDINNILSLIRNNNIIFTDCNYEIFDTNSKQIYLLVNGKLNNNTFSQSFLLTFNKKWILQHSILLIP